MKGILKEIKKHTPHVAIRTPPRNRGGASSKTAPSPSHAATATTAAATEASPLIPASTAGETPPLPPPPPPAGGALNRMEEGKPKAVSFDPSATRAKNNETSSTHHRNNNSNNNGPNTGSAVAVAFDASSSKRDVEYDGDDHWAVMIQLYGSVWPHVFPWCIITILWTSFVIYLKQADYADLTIHSSTGHNFMSILVAFLVVTRATITYNRFMEARQYLSDLFRCARELIQYTCLLTNQNTNAKAKQWRHLVAYRTIVTVRVAIAAVEYRSYGINLWEDVLLDDGDYKSTEIMMSKTEQKKQQKQKKTNSTKKLSTATTTPPAVAEDEEDHSENSMGSSSSGDFALHSLSHGPRTLQDEHFRAPIVWAYNLRETVLQPRLDPEILAERDWHVNESLKLLTLVSDLVAAFHGLKKLVLTPFPFPLVQMTRTFLFAWVFSLPLVLAGENDSWVEILVLTFFCTYGFLGLEYVNMELDDPFGDDPNDFSVRRWAQQVYEDIYIAIYKTDGYDSAVALRSRITERMARGSGFENYQNDIAKDGFWQSGAPDTSSKALGRNQS